MRKIVLILLAAIVSCGFLLPKNRTKSEGETVYPTVILGGGVGALTSSLYLSRAQVLPIVIEGKIPGGIITQSHLVENWPGEMGISGMDLAEKLKKQAVANGAEFASEEAINVDLSSFPYIVTTRDVNDPEKTFQYKTYSVIVAMGTTPNYLGVPGEQKYWGQGVTNCATCDGSLYHGKTVAVIGGGDAAIVEADYLSHIAKKVNIYVRKDKFRASDIALKEAVLKKDNIEVFYETQVKEVLGDSKGVNAVYLTNKGTERKESIDGVFLAIGSTPNTKLLDGKIELDNKGYVSLEKDQQTSREGVFAIGDIADETYKQAISAAGDGAKAAMQTEKYLRTLQVKDDTISYLRPESKMLAHRLPKNEKKEIAVRSAVTPSKKVNQGKVIEIRSTAQFNKEINTNLPVLVDFYATWCGPCKRISPEIDKVAKQLSGRVKILKVDIDKFKNLADKYEIRSMPTVVVLSNKKVVDNKVGSAQILPYVKKLVKAEDIDSVL